MQEKEQPVEHALKEIKELMNSAAKSFDNHEDILELTEDDLYDELDEDYQYEFAQEKSVEKTISVNENLTQISHPDIAGRSSFQDSATQGKLASDEIAEKSATIKELIKKMEKPTADPVKFSKNTTLEELAAEAIKPLLKEWLNQHLPAMVQQAVEDEVKRLILKKDMK